MKIKFSRKKIVGTQRPKQKLTPAQEDFVLALLQQSTNIPEAAQICKVSEAKARSWLKLPDVCTGFMLAHTAIATTTMLQLKHMRERTEARAEELVRSQEEPQKLQVALAQLDLVNRTIEEFKNRLILSMEYLLELEPVEKSVRTYGLCLITIPVRLGCWDIVEQSGLQSMLPAIEREMASLLKDLTPAERTHPS